MGSERPPWHFLNNFLPWANPETETSEDTTSMVSESPLDGVDRFSKDGDAYYFGNSESRAETQLRIKLSAAFCCKDHDVSGTSLLKPVRKIHVDHPFKSYSPVPLKSPPAYITPPIGSEFSSDKKETFDETSPAIELNGAGYLHMLVALSQQLSIKLSGVREHMTISYKLKQLLVSTKEENYMIRSKHFEEGRVVKIEIYMNEVTKLFLNERVVLQTAGVKKKPKWEVAGDVTQLDFWKLEGFPLRRCLTRK